MFPGFPSLVSSALLGGGSRVFLSVVVGYCSWRGDGRVLRSCSGCLVGAGAEPLAFVSWRGVVLALILRLSSRQSSCLLVSSIVSFLMSCGAVWRGVLARLIAVIHLVGRGFPCLPISSCRSPPSRGAGCRALLGGGVSWRVAGGDLFVVWHWRVRVVSSCHRLAWRGVRPPSRHCASSLVSWGGEVLASRFVSAGADGRWFSSCRFVVCACLSSLPAGDVAMPCSSSVYRRFRLLLVIIWLRGMGGGVRGVLVRLVVACFLPSRSLLVPLSRLGTTGREAGRRAAWLSGRGSSGLVD